MGDNKDNLEIERKFLLRNTPVFPNGENSDRTPVKRLLIHQVYIEIDGIVNRYRMTEDMRTDERVYHHCIKKVLSPGVFEEIEEEIEKSKFDEVSESTHRYIIKVRTVYNENGFNWEIDNYIEMKLVTLEVELDDINQDIEIPEYIKPLVISELTGQKEFSNHSLSTIQEM